MGQAATDLPAASDDSPPVADDLLSQLAGEDIDRMLAEADVDTTPAAASAAPVDSAVEPASAAQTPDDPAAVDAKLSDELDALVSEINQESGSNDAASSATPEAPAPDSKLASEAEAAPASARTGDAVEPTDSPEAVAAGSREDSAAAEETDKAAKTDAVGLGTSPGPPAAAAPPAATRSQEAATESSGKKEAPNTVPADDDAPWPLYLRILESLNSPLDRFPDFVRDIVGKIALVTLINALAVIGYVLLFRKK